MDESQIGKKYKSKVFFFKYIYNVILLYNIMIIVLIVLNSSSNVNDAVVLVCNIVKEN